MRRLVVRPEAENDVALIFDYYQRINPILALRFIEAVSRCMEAVHAQPEVWPRATKTKRKYMLHIEDRSFAAYVLYYTFDESAVIVQACDAWRSPPSLVEASQQIDLRRAARFVGELFGADGEGDGARGAVGVGG